MTPETIRFSISPYSLSPGTQFRYVGRNIFITHQFGFWRVNFDTGQVQTVVGIGYQQPTFPPARLGYVAGDQNQTVTQVGASDLWIVVDNIGNAVGIGQPSAIVFKNDPGLSTHGVLPKQTGFWWSRAKRPRIVGDLVYVPNDQGAWDYFDANLLKWIGHAAPPAAIEQSGIDGFTYSIAIDGDPWAGGTYHQSNFILTRSGTVQPPAPPPVAPTPTPVPPTPVPLTVEQRLDALEARMHALDGR